MPLKLKKAKTNVQSKKKTVSKEAASATVRKGVYSKCAKSKKGSASAKQTAKVGIEPSELSIPLPQIDVSPQLQLVSRQAHDLGSLQSKESALLEIIFNDASTRQIVRQHIKAAKEELKSRLEMELPRKIDNAFNVPGSSQPEKLKRFGLNLQVKDFDASEKFANSLYDVFNKYRSQMSLGSLGKLF